MSRTFLFILSQQILEMASSNRRVSTRSYSTRLISLDIMGCGECSCDETESPLQSLRAGTDFVFGYPKGMRAQSRRALAQRRQHSGFVMWMVGGHLRSLGWRNLQYSIENDVKVFGFSPHSPFPHALERVI